MIIQPCHRDRGEVSVQSVILVPVVFLIALMCFHVGSLLHQSHVAHVAAARGAEVAVSTPWSPNMRETAMYEIERVVRDLASSLAHVPDISHEPGGVRISVSLKASSALPFLPQVASASVWQPWESFRREQDRQ